MKCGNLLWEGAEEGEPRSETVREFLPCRLSPVGRLCPFSFVSGLLAAYLEMFRLPKFERAASGGWGQVTPRNSGVDVYSGTWRAGPALGHQSRQPGVPAPGRLHHPERVRTCLPPAALLMPSLLLSPCLPFPRSSAPPPCFLPQWPPGCQGSQWKHRPALCRTPWPTRLPQAAAERESLSGHRCG